MEENRNEVQETPTTPVSPAETNNIQFHDDTPTAPEAQPQKGPMGIKGKLALLFFLIYVGFNIYSFIVNLNTTIDASSISDGLEAEFSIIDTLLGIIAFASFVCSIVFGAMTVKEARVKNTKGRGIGLLAIIGPFVIGVVFSILSFATGPGKDAFSMGFKCAQVNNCVKSEDGKTATCAYQGEEVECPAALLTEDQFAEE